MKTQQELKEMVKEKYSAIALADQESNSASCCGSGSCSTEVTTIMADDYANLEGYNPDADLGLGCGLPTEFAKIKEGDTVLDLGSGAGNDAFIARHETGETGKVIGIDFTDAMVERAKLNNQVRGFTNVEFILSDIQEMPVESDTVDVVVSNCVLNLVPDKASVYKEVFRVLKPGAHFSISDIVLEGELPVELQTAAEMYAGCVSGAIQRNTYLELIREAGFKNIIVQKDKQILIPNDILNNYLPEQSIKTYLSSASGIYSITVYAEKPKQSGCCDTACCN